VEGEIRVGATKASNEVVFERSDGSFGGIAAVDMGWYELEINLFVVHEIF
jgi:hypothetical protein